MITGYHLIFGAYGFWLPNDPRGSWSDFVHSYELLRYGEATTTTARRSVAYRPHDHEQRLAAKKALKYPAVQFTGVQARAIGQGFADYVQKSNVKVWACAILSDHVHLVTGRLPIKAEQFVIQLKGAATRRLIEEDLHPLRQFPIKKNRPPRCFAQGEWKVYLDPEDILRAIRYVEQNPIRERKPRQNWSFVTPYLL